MLFRSDIAVLCFCVCSAVWRVRAHACVFSHTHTQIRKDGVRLFIIWYQILQNNNDTENHQIFSKLVSLFGDDESYFMFSEVLSMPSAESKIITINSVTFPHR